VRVLPSDLVVDASGRSSNTPAWLEAAGYAVPDEIQVNAHWGYSSCFVNVPEGFDPGFFAFSALPKGKVAGDHPTKTRGASMWIQDGDHRWILTAMGSAGDHPPGDEAGLRAFIASLGYEELDAAVAQVQLIGSPRVWRNTINRLRRYDTVAMPDRFVVVGDAFAAFNPVYGQGMTVAAMGAANLQAELASGSTIDGLTARVQSRLAADALFCWDMATGADYRVDGVVGPPQPDGVQERTAYMDRVEALSSEDSSVYLKFWETAQLLRSAEWLDDEQLRRRVRDDWDRLGKLVGADV
jgi:2-polyprenyl-6-methoxyphenol hydroxylase-like FAD-dependent oxidoreductase